MKLFKRVLGKTMWAGLALEAYNLFTKERADSKAAETFKALNNQDSRLKQIEADLLILKWMAGVLLVGVLVLLIKAFV